MRRVPLLFVLLLICTACSPPDHDACTRGLHVYDVRVPLDRQQPSGPSLDLGVIATDNVDAPRGVLLLLAGGPGQPGARCCLACANNLHPDVLREYRVVMFDQRGTGPRGSIALLYKRLWVVRTF